jgi:predicted nucleotidyltransferase
MTLETLLNAKRDEILHLCAKYGARNVRVFGSVARGEADAQSDIDFLVELEPGRTLFDLGGLQYDLEQLLRCRVDVVTERGLKPRIRERALREAVSLCCKGRSLLLRISRAQTHLAES